MKNEDQALIDIISAAEVAEILNISDSHVYQLAKGKVKGKATLPCIMKNKNFIFDRKKIMNYGIENNFIKVSSQEQVVLQEQVSLKEQVTRGIAKVRTKLVPRSDKIKLIVPKGDKNEVARVRKCNLIISENGTGILNSRQSSKGPHCFISKEIIEEGIRHLNDGYEVIHRFIDIDGGVTYEEDLTATVERLNRLGFNPTNGKFGPYYVATLNGYFLDPMQQKKWRW